MEEPLDFSPSTLSGDEPVDDGTHIEDIGEGSIGGDSYGSDRTEEADDKDDGPRAPRVHARRGARGQPAVSGLLIFLVLSPGLWPGMEHNDLPTSAHIGGSLCWGSILAEWRLKEFVEEAEDCAMARLASAVCRHVPAFGTLLYRAVDFIKMRPLSSEYAYRAVDIGPGNHLPHSVLDIVRDEQAERAGVAPGAFGELLQNVIERCSSPLRIVRLSPGLIRLLFGRRRHIFHAVSITERVNWKRIPGPPPSRRGVLEFRRAVGVLHNNHLGPRSNVRQRKALDHVIPVGDIVDWLFSNRHLKNSEEIKVAAHDFARIYTKDPCLRASLRQGKTHMNREVLRKARPRLDCVAMLLSRAMFAAQDWGSLSIYLFCDGSPQWRGWELYASTMDVFATDFSKRLLLPVVCLARNMLDLHGISREKHVISIQLNF